MNLIPVIGLEIHVQLKTKSKMFCSCVNVLGDAPPNTSICPICMGYPGTLPVPNRQAIEWTQLAGAALGCELATESKFDRKSYFYPDLPKGYQISQYDKPFCLKGEFTIVVNGEERTIGITRIHLEEDAAKNTHSKDGKSTLVDYNRAGTALMEIVTEPDIASPEEARIFLQELQRVMRSLGVSDADMERGQMRCDANISLRVASLPQGKPFDIANLNPKTEIKNVNSFKFVEKALNYGKGFHAEDVPHSDPLFLVALAAFMNRRYRARASGISGQLAGHEVKVGEQFVVVTLGAEGQNQHNEVTVSDFEDKSGSSAVLVGGTSYQISSNATLGQIRVQGACNGQGFTAQVERGVGKNPLALRIAHNGTQIDALVLSPLGARLHKLMPFKAPPDLSKFLLSPMPGLLVDVAVQPGQKVQAGEKLVVIEAMKMENILFAAQDGVVGKITAGKGDSLAVDQIILEFV